MSHGVSTARRYALIVAILAWVMPATGLRAQDQVDPDAYSAAVDLIEVSDIGSSLNLLVDQIGGQLTARVEELVPAMKGQAGPVVQEVLGPLWVSGRDQIMHEVAKAYALKLTAEELREIAAFYATPAGRKLTAVQPDLQNQVARIGRQWAQAVASQINQGVRAKLKQMGHEF